MLTNSFVDLNVDGRKSPYKNERINSVGSFLRPDDHNQNYYILITIALSPIHILSGFPNRPKYCGNVAPDFTMSATNQVEVVFSTDRAFVGKGFDICFTVVRKRGR